MKTPTVRLANLVDVPKLGVLFDAYRQFYEQTPDVRLATTFVQRRMERNQSVIFLAEWDDGSAIGFCQLYPTFCSVEAAPVMVLYDLYVAPAARQLGLGKALLLAAEAHASQSGCVRLDLTTAKTNFTAQRLYESLGWVREEQFFTYQRHLPCA